MLQRLDLDDYQYGWPLHRRKAYGHCPWIYLHSLALCGRGHLLHPLPDEGEGRGEGGIKAFMETTTKHRKSCTDKVANARSLRKRSTDAERLLWKHLRLRGLSGCKFRRQQPIGEYIVDFVCFEKRVVIELDGGQHTEQVDYDEKEAHGCENEGIGSYDTGTIMCSSRRTLLRRTF